MPVITDIREQPGDNPRWAVFVDGQYMFTVSLQEVLAFRLAVGKEVGAEWLASIAEAADLRRAREYAVRLLSLRDYSEAELRRKLQGKGYAEALVERVLGGLRESGLVDDRRFAEHFVRQRLASGQVAPWRVAWDLRARGVSPTLVEEILAAASGTPEYPLALQIAERRQARLRGDSPAAQRRKLALFLQRRGFAHETIARVLETILPSE